VHIYAITLIEEVKAMEKDKLLEHLQNERELLIKKVKIGIYVGFIVIITALLLILDLALNREPIFPMLGSVAQFLISIIILAIVILGPVVFIIRNFVKYQKFEEMAEKILFND
jgi:hypothetical protein